MMATNNLNLIKSLLVACDQSYFLNATGLVGTALQPLEDRNQSIEEYKNQQIYKDVPVFTWDSGYKISNAIDVSSIGAKLVIYTNANNDVIVAFGGTDGTSLQG